MKLRTAKIAALLMAAAIALAGCANTANTAGSVNLNSLSLDELTAKAKQDGEVNSAGMPDSWANWGQTWSEITEKYGIKHTDVDMSSAEELALFASEKNNATKDIGDVGQSFGPTAVAQGLALPYKTTYWDSIPDWAKDKDGSWIIAYYGTISVVVNKDLVKTVPASFADILAGDYKVSVGDVTKAAQAQCAVLAAAMAYGGSETNIQPGIDYFQKLAKQGRLDLGELSLARLQKGEIALAFLWDYNALGYRDQIKADNPSADYVVSVPSEASVQSGYCTVINPYAKHPYAAALTREYIFSDAGQINLARGYAKPVRDVALPDDVAAKMIPNEQYKNAKMIGDQNAWAKTVEGLGAKWQEDVIAYAS
ncbi:putative spermidine/putrescine transport system substrate-binding protein [Sporobacter termitidis DSM 10068]|uniref:Putative spermidine/putrescine transport system substrate-binding protein n=1 Tax=Sporobacter termitidis DSM 10068 TaxID=1123282 RepID=A0A1M5XSB8_9FIRM|nr:ABC transporter substrate-binding protein [Sporobacter termitidis]SHI02163.1 putative spermidine/putrescine transport system substrate-binding protein [Sporobacter termitidis DSM 10068]